MLEIIDEILRIEHEAEALLSTAKAEAQDELARFDREERKELDEARRGADTQRAERVSTARAKLQDDYDLAINRLRNATERFAADHEEQIKTLARSLVQRLCETEPQRLSSSKNDG